ncbi:hypothetical protein ACWGIU_03855 [Streptomyces sp. NPDC054840]
MLDHIRAGRPDVRILVFSRNPEHSRAHHPDVDVVAWEGVCRERISEHLRRLSVLVLGGGGILYTPKHAGTCGWPALPRIWAFPSSPTRWAPVR